MIEDLDKNFKSIGFILDISQFDNYQKIYEKLSFEESILESSLHGFEQIDFSKKDYLKSDLYKSGNILLIPYKHEKTGWYLSPWQILNTDNGTTLHCKHILFNKCFDETRFDENSSNIWKNSSLRKYLNSNKFLKRFPVAIQNNIGFHDIWTDQKITSDRFWLLSWQDLGEVGKQIENIFKIDYPSKKTIYNSDIFKNKKDLIIKYFTSPASYWWLRSAYDDDSHFVALVYYDGTVNHEIACDSNNGCTPAFILG